MNCNVFTLARWWNGRNLQTRLFLVFTALFVFCAIILFVFLLNSVRMIDLNNQAHTIYDRNRQLYQLKALTRVYELDINQFEINASLSAEQELASVGENLDENIAGLRSLLPEKELAGLEKFKNAKSQLSPMIDEIIRSIYTQDQMSVEMLDSESGSLFSAMYDEIDAIYGRSAEELRAISTKAQMFSQVAGLVRILVIPAVLLLALIAALIMYNQIDQPLDQLTSASGDLLEGKFQAADLGQLAKRSDEIGSIAHEFITMAAAIEQHATQLQQVADEIRAKIR